MIVFAVHIVACMPAYWVDLFSESVLINDLTCCTIFGRALLMF